MRNILPVVVVVAAVGLAGCGNQPAKPAPTSTASATTSPARQVMTFGEDRKGKHGNITVSKPVPYDLPADPARSKDLTRGVKFDIKITNTTRTAFTAETFSFSATTDGTAASLVTDEKNRIGAKLQGDILPGKDGQLAMVVALPAKPSEVNVKVHFTKVDPLYWTGTV